MMSIKAKKEGMLLAEQDVSVYMEHMILNQQIDEAVSSGQKILKGKENEQYMSKILAEKNQLELTTNKLAVGIHVKCQKSPEYKSWYDVTTRRFGMHGREIAEDVEKKLSKIPQSTIDQYADPKREEDVEYSEKGVSILSLRLNNFSDPVLVADEASNYVKNEISLVEEGKMTRFEMFVKSKLSANYERELIEECKSSGKTDFFPGEAGPLSHLVNKFRKEDLKLFAEMLMQKGTEEHVFDLLIQPEKATIAIKEIAEKNKKIAEMEAKTDIQLANNFEIPEYVLFIKAQMKPDYERELHKQMCKEQLENNPTASPEDIKRTVNAELNKMMNSAISNKKEDSPIVTGDADYGVRRYEAHNNMILKDLCRVSELSNGLGLTQRPPQHTPTVVNFDWNEIVKTKQEVDMKKPQKQPQHDMSM